MEKKTDTLTPITFEVTVYDPLVKGVIDKIVSRHIAGTNEYNQTFTEEIESGNKGKAEYLNDMEEELTDYLIYLAAFKKSPE